MNIEEFYEAEKRRTLILTVVVDGCEYPIRFYSGLENPETLSTAANKELDPGVSVKFVHKTVKAGKMFRHPRQVPEIFELAKIAVLTDVSLFLRGNR